MPLMCRSSPMLIFPFCGYWFPGPIRIRMPRRGWAMGVAGVGDGVALGDGVSVGTGVLVDVGVFDGVDVLVWVSVSVGVRVGVSVGASVGVSDGVGGVSDSTAAIIATAV